jgi:hypothetical protein
VEKKDSQHSEEEDQEVTAIVNSCLRVITEDTEHSSNPISARYTPVSTPPHLASTMQLQAINPMDIGSLLPQMG